MASAAESAEADQVAPEQNVALRGVLSAFEQLIANKPPILESLVAQLPTESILALYHTSSFLNSFLKSSPTSWRYVSWRLHQPALQSATPINNSATPNARLSSSYALDQLLLYVINPFSTRLTSLELDNTAVSGATLFQTVMYLRKDTLEHLSVRGCKNVSLKYHINPWLTMHAMAQERPVSGRAPGYEKLALKSLYTYRCRHHRRRPYLPSSLTRKESDSEPTHELVLTCHKLGIWTDTAWCTTPGARCFRRRGYVTMRVPQDPREVWVVFDRLWRSRNWLGPVPETRQTAANKPTQPSKKRKRDCRSWEVDEEAMNGEPIGILGDGKDTPAHLRKTHRQFVDNIFCDNCSDSILERCEQCSVMMHCVGCRKTLCASCAFDRPYLRNKNAPDEERSKYWWAPGCAVSPCSMQDQDSPPPGPAGNVANAQPSNSTPSIKFKWCCTEPVFSGGGGITFGSGSTRETDRIRAAPLKMGQGWEDPEFSSHHDGSCELAAQESDAAQIGSPLSRADEIHGPVGGRWPSIDKLFSADPIFDSDQSVAGVPRILCDDCHSSEQWKIKCKACTIALCLKHDVKERLKVRICGYKDLNVEKAEYKSRQTALKLLTLIMMRRRKGKLKAAEDKAAAEKEAVLKEMVSKSLGHIPMASGESLSEDVESGLLTPRPTRVAGGPVTLRAADLEDMIASTSAPLSGSDVVVRPISPGSNSTGPPSRTSSPAPSAQSSPATPEPNNTPQRPNRPDDSPPLWRGCQSFFCPPTRTPGDHRRRCIAAMRQCAECKIHICELCVSGLPPPCPCKGCRTPSDGEPAVEPVPEENLRFFCPNCRWGRIKTGRCRQKVFDKSSRKDKKKSTKPSKATKRFRKPIEQRQSHLDAATSGPAQAADDLVMDHLREFMGAVALQERPPSVLAALKHLPVAKTSLSARTLSSLPPPCNGSEEMSELENMGQLARDLIDRIQALRRQFGPGSTAALALPNVTVQDQALQVNIATATGRLSLQDFLAPTRAPTRAPTQQAIEVDDDFLVVDAPEPTTIVEVDSDQAEAAAAGADPAETNGAENNQQI